MIPATSSRNIENILKYLRELMTMEGMGGGSCGRNMARMLGGWTVFCKWCKMNEEVVSDARKTSGGKGGTH
jgi:hypothetical protein